MKIKEALLDENSRYEKECPNPMYDDAPTGGDDWFPSDDEQTESKHIIEFRETGSVGCYDIFIRLANPEEQMDLESFKIDLEFAIDSAIQRVKTDKSIADLKASTQGTIDMFKTLGSYFNPNR